MSDLMPLQGKLRNALNTAGFSPDWFLIPLAAIIGVAGALVAIGFDWLVEASSHFFFTELVTGGFVGRNLILLLLLPAIGGLAVGLFGRYISKSPPTHGVSDVVEAIAKKQGQISGRSGLFKIITSSLTIGSGGSAGVEAPIILIGSSVASFIGRTLKLGRNHMHTLLGCGAAACTASLFNAPIAGVLFVLEVVLRDFSVKTFMPIVVASVFGTAVTQAILGENEAVFTIPDAMRDYQFMFTEIGAYAVLGLLCGAVGAAYIVSMTRIEAFWKGLNIPRFLKPALGGLALGVLGVAFVLIFSGEVSRDRAPAFYANGYHAIEAMLDPQTYRSYGIETGEIANTVAEQADASPPTSAPYQVEQVRNEREEAAIAVLLAVLAFKFLGSCLTIGSGGSGGIIAPSLFMGATLGGLFALVLERTGFFPGSTPATYALAGMAGMIAATAHAPLTSFLMVFEITHDYKVILPMMLVAILATTCSQFIHRDSMFLVWIRQRGIRMGDHADMTLLRRLLVHDVPLLTPVVVHPDDPAQRLIDLAADDAAVDFVVTDHEEHYVGMVVGQDVRTTLVQREAIPLMIVEELMRTDLPTCARDETLDAVLDKFSSHEVESLAVIGDSGRVKGVVSRARLMRQYHLLLEQRS